MKNKITVEHDGEEYEAVRYDSANGEKWVCVSDWFTLTAFVVDAYEYPRIAGRITARNGYGRPSHVFEAIRHKLIERILNHA